MDFSEKLISWFEKNKRDLPWRNTQNPYFIWLSEIILQQTRVEQGLPYYQKFIVKYPAIKHLAQASEDEVLKLWQGLGYYTRARNLHHTSKMICEKHRGEFPRSYEEILKLKGIGKYTAAAIASFAYNLVYPVVDGNVERVLARVFGIADPVNSAVAKKKFYALAEKLIDKKDPGTFNQAIMEFGAIHCTPSNPQCGTCIFKKECIALNADRVQELPAKSPKTEQRNRYFNYLVIKRGNNIFLRKREKKDIWRNLYEFPLIELKRQSGKKEVIASSEWNNIFRNIKYEVNAVSEDQVHILSHQRIYARFWEISISGREAKSQAMKSFVEIRRSDLKAYAVPRLIERYLQKR